MYSFTEFLEEAVQKRQEDENGLIKTDQQMNVTIEAVRMKGKKKKKKKLSKKKKAKVRKTNKASP